MTTRLMIALGLWAGVAVAFAFLYMWGFNNKLRLVRLEDSRAMCYMVRGHAGIHCFPKDLD